MVAAVLQRFPGAEIVDVTARAAEPEPLAARAEADEGAEGEAAWSFEVEGEDEEA